MASGQPWVISADEEELAACIRHNLCTALSGSRPLDVVHISGKQADTDLHIYTSAARALSDLCTAIRHAIGVTSAAQQEQERARATSPPSQLAKRAKISADALSPPTHGQEPQTHDDVTSEVIAELHPDQELGDVSFVRDPLCSKKAIFCDLCAGLGPEWLGERHALQQQICYGTTAYVSHPFVLFFVFQAADCGGIALASRGP